jgi:hypothetical protein
MAITALLAGAAALNAAIAVKQAAGRTIPFVASFDHPADPPVLQLAAFIVAPPAAPPARKEPHHGKAAPPGPPAPEPPADTSLAPLPPVEDSAPGLPESKPAGKTLASMLPPGLAYPQPAPRIESPVADRILALLPPLAAYDERPPPVIGQLTDEQIAALLPPLPDFDRRSPPPVPPPPPPLLEPYMQATDDWLVKTWIHRNPGIQKVHFAPHVQARCLPSKLLEVLYDAAMRFGDVRVISGYRSPSHNRRVGGASRSLHLECRAIDFFIQGPGTGVVDWLIARREVGGYKRYPFGSFHIDNGPRRTWGWGKRRRGGGVKVAAARRRA